jgi:hypothetical protein
MVVLCATFVLLTIVAYSPTISQSQYDDSYITYRYAHHLMSGDGLVFNLGQRVNSATSLFYTLLLAGRKPTRQRTRQSVFNDAEARLVRNAG